ncbi:Multidrug resistance-associated protein 1 [Pseudolycoriella hygida]|uniref:ABC-type glutathione-S-conjugate transporter n=1 Tax=Pseudolycoriella hygida TaxID=35572 RepID=A0A9Q0S9H6_9DIPT|nr:Multidrug resistance-associated protein 1 [Pseudolycoriella hygida]
MEDFCGSPFWDSSLTWDTYDPFFTPCFELTVLVWAPCVFLWVFTPLEVYYIRTSKYSSMPWGFLNISRLVLTILLFVITLADLIMAIVREGDGAYNVHIVTPAVKLLSFMLTAILAYFHRKNGVNSSGLMFFFWFFLVLFAIPQYRTEIVRYMERSEGEELSFGTGEIVWADYQFLSYMLYFPLIVFQLVSQLFADKFPTKMKSEEYYVKSENPNPEIKASFIRKLLFIWFEPMTWRGFRKPLETEDMWDIRPDDTSRSMVPDFDKHWIDSIAKGERQRQKEKLKKNSKDKNLNSKSTRGSVIIPLFKSFGGPFYFAGFLKLLIDLLSFASPQVLSLLIGFTFSDDPLWHGMIFAVALFLISFITSILNGQYLYRCFLVGFRIRSVLISAIYRKALTISNAAKRDITVGEIVNLMAVDAQRFFELIQYVHIIWSGPLVIALALYFLWDILGVAVVAGLIVMILSLPLNGFVATKLKHYQVKQMARKDERVKLMNETLSGIKVLKLYAWEMSFQEMIQKVRDRELKVILHAAYMNAVIFMAWNVLPFLVTLASFATYVLMDPSNKIDATTAFVALSLFNILRMPMTMVPLLISMLMQTWVSIVRINKFLNSEDLDPNAVSHLKDEHALKIEGATFSWEGDESVLKHINLSVGKGSLAAVVGPVGSGKSSLISSILGETVKKSGSVNTDGSMAFVAQQAWIQNATLKDNILFGKPFDPAWYSKVVDACALTPDIKMLPGGDQTEIGEKGINLSGGQKQRVALARAVYSGADIYLLDDPLSAVDSHVGKHIFEEVIGPRGLLSGKTRLLVTHGISYLPFVDTIYVMSHGEITENGHYDKLIAQKGAFADFIVEHLREMEEDEEELNVIKEALTPSVNGSIIFERAISVRASQTKAQRLSEEF